MFGTTPSTATGSTLGRSASFSFSQPPANKPFSGTSGGFSFGGNSSNSTTSATTNTTAVAAPSSTGATAGTTGGLSFGAPKPAAAPAASGGLFGSSTTQSQPQTQQSGGLFGSSTSTTGTGGLFGAKPNNPAPASGGFSFGSSNTASTSNTGGGLFGSSTQPAQQQQQPSSSLFSFNSSQPQQQQQQGNTFQNFSSQPQPSPFSQHPYFQKERFNDLPPEAAKLIEQLDSHISSQLQLRDELKTRSFGEEIQKCAAEWHDLSSALTSLSATLDADASQSTDVSTLLETDRKTTSQLYSIILNARNNPSSSDGAGVSFAEWLTHFFSDLAIEYRERISRYSSTVETIQHHLASLSSRETYTPQAVSDAIHAQHESFMTLAGQVAGLHAEVEALKKDYARWYKTVNKSVRDPFASMANGLAGSVPNA